MREHAGNRVRHRRAGIAVKRFPQFIEWFCGRVGCVLFRRRRLRLLRVIASGAGRLRRNRGLRGFRLNIGNSSSAICFINGICCGGFRPGISSSDLNGHGSNIVGNDFPGYVIGIHCCRFLLAVRQDVGDNDFASIIAEIGFGRTPVSASSIATYCGAYAASNFSESCSSSSASSEIGCCASSLTGSYAGSCGTAAMAGILGKANAAECRPGACLPRKGAKRQLPALRGCSPENAVHRKAKSCMPPVQSSSARTFPSRT